MSRQRTNVKEYYYDVIDSTNAEARRLWEKVHDNPFVVVAGEQRAGIGREGRLWHSPFGGIWMTVAFPLEMESAAYAALPPAIGLAVTRLLKKEFNLSAAIKWPNDVFVNGRKICGILCQTSTAIKPPVIFVGIGVNGDFNKSDLGTDLRSPATTLRDELPHHQAIKPREVASALTKEIEEILFVYTQNGFRALTEEINQSLLWKNEKVTNGEFSGVIERVCDDGRLLLRTENGNERFSSGELNHLSADDTTPSNQ